MENASKALLVAAAILVVIILIAVGMKIYSSTTDTQKVAMDTGKTISDKTGIATDMATSAINGQNYSPVVEISSITEENYGEYIDLGKSIVGTDATTDDWKILYNDESEGKVYAILADYMPNTTENIFEGLDLYSTYSVGKTSGRSDYLINRLKNESIWKRLLSEKLKNNSKITVRGAFTKEEIISIYNKKNNGSLQNNSHTNQFLYLDPNNTSNGIDTLFVHTNTRKDECYGYWLATPNVGAGSFFVWKVDYSGNITCDSCTGTMTGTRPIAILNSNLKVKKVNNVWQIVE